MLLFNSHRPKQEVVGFHGYFLVSSERVARTDEASKPHFVLVWKCTENLLLKAQN